MQTTATSIAQYFPFAPTASQQEVFALLQDFVQPGNTEDFFVLKGAAGTGKTTLVKAVVQYLQACGIHCCLNAPTGRAARVLSAKTGLEARTMHSQIYTPEPVEDSYSIRLLRKVAEPGAPAVYIVDEASMVPASKPEDQSFIAPDALLPDFIAWVKAGNPRSKILFIGDACQLPPVNEEISPALSANCLQKRFGLTGGMAELNGVKRQQEGSPILQVAGRLRHALLEGGSAGALQVPKFASVWEGLDHYVRHMDVERPESAVMLAWTNRDVNWLNGQARKRMFRQPAVLQRGDLVTLSQNWRGDGPDLLKGDTGVVQEVDLQRTEEVAGLRFARVQVRFSGLHGEPLYAGALALLDVLTSHNGSVHYTRKKELFHRAMKHNPAFRRTRMVWDDPYLGAMQLRYGYALTVHKAQGGEWDRVYLHPYMDHDLRWQYTAVTRARQHLHLL